MKSSKGLEKNPTGKRLYEMNSKKIFLKYMFLRGLSQIVPGARTASKNYYLSHIILLTVRAPGLICESPLSNNRKLYSFIDSKVTQNILKLFS